MKPDHPHANQAYETSDAPQTVAFYATDSTIALPYHLLRSIHLSAHQIRIEFNDYIVTVGGTALGKLWRELCAYRVKEIAINRSATGELSAKAANRCSVAKIEITPKADELPEDGEI